MLSSTISLSPSTILFLPFFVRHSFSKPSHPFRFSLAHGRISFLPLAVDLLHFVRTLRLRFSDGSNRIVFVPPSIHRLSACSFCNPCIVPIVYLPYIRLVPSSNSVARGFLAGHSLSRMHFVVEAYLIVPSDGMSDLGDVVVLLTFESSIPSTRLQPPRSAGG